jgi:hypothetical protein
LRWRGASGAAWAGHKGRASALTRLVEDRLPAEYTATGHHDAWPLIATALLSRMTTTLQHIFDLQRRGRFDDAEPLLETAGTAARGACRAFLTR